MVQRVKVGIVGAGVIAQVMHLNYLRELSDRFEIAALCDIALANAEANADSYGIPKVFSDWREMLKEPIDAVLICRGRQGRQACPRREAHVLLCCRGQGDA
jgi:predicted dehydrogenase